MHDERITSFSCNDGPVLPDIPEPSSAAGPAGQDGHDLDILLLAEFSVPSMSYGIRAGIMGPCFGGYASFRSGFRPSDFDYACLSDGTMPDGGTFWPGVSARTSAMSVYAGLLVQTVPWLTAYAGAGYGRTSQMWQDVDGRWAQVSDLSFEGPSAEAGAILTWKMLAFSAGFSTVSFKTLDFAIGLGLRF